MKHNIVDGVKSLKSVVECNVCHNIMTQPRRLNCLHHFCLSCINNMMETNQQGDRSVNCPTCKKSSNNIQSSFIMNNLLDIYRAQKGDDNTQSDDNKVCQQCDGPNPTSVCLQCNTELCDKCQERHLRFPIMKGHIIEPIEQGNENNVTITNSCREHSYTISYSCKKCSEAGCAECMLNDHSGHKTESIEEALDTIVTSTRKHMDTINKHQENIKEQLDEIEKVIKQCDTNCNDTKKDIKEHRDGIIQKIKTASRDNIDDIISKMASKYIAHVTETNTEDSEERKEDVTHENKTDTAENAHDVIQKIKTTDINCNDAKGIKQRKKRLLQKIKTDSAHLLELVDNNANEKLKELETAKSELESELSSQESLLSWTNTVINMTKGPATLCELQQGLYQRVEKTAKGIVVTDVNTEISLACFTANRTLTQCQSNLIGEVTFKNQRTALKKRYDKFLSQEGGSMKVQEYIAYCLMVLCDLRMVLLLLCMLLSMQSSLIDAYLNNRY